MVKFSEKPLKLIASASALPGPSVCNEQLFDAILSQCAKSGDDSGKSKVRRAKAIAKRLGIERRHFARAHTTALGKPSPDGPDLGVQILATLLNDSKLSENDIDYLITHTASPHTQVPGNSAWIADRAGLICPYMELRQACTGFANALFVASGMFATTDEINTIAITGMEVGSVFFNLTPEFLDEEQLLNYMQMGDGAGGVLVGAWPSEPAAASADKSGMISDIYHGHIGVGRNPGFYLSGAGSSDVADNLGNMPRFRHNGAMVKTLGADLFLTAIQCMSERGYSLQDFDWIIPHQASGRIGQLLSDHTNIPVERFVVDAQSVGNLGSAAIWVSLDRLIRSGKLLTGQKVLVLGAEATKYMYGGFVYRH